nr:deoxynucleoside kinase [Candidatus Levybacteria bacterium]
IEILGNIASGKTTTAHRIAHISSFAYMDVDVYKKNPFLCLFATNRRRWAFTNEISFSFERSKKIPQILKQTEAEPIVLDSGFDMGHFVYAKTGFLGGDMTEEEWKLLAAMHEKLLTHAPTINAAIFLDVPIDLLMKRMWKRGREFEQDYSRKYIMDVQAQIDAYKNDCIALKKRKIIATYHQVEKELEFHTAEDSKLKKLFSSLDLEAE